MLTTDGLRANHMNREFVITLVVAVSAVLFVVALLFFLFRQQKSQRPVINDAMSQPTVKSPPLTLAELPYGQAL